MISALLRNEAYIGNLVYNRVAQKLGTKKTNNPKDLWIRSEGCIEPIIDRDVFRRAKKILEEKCVRISEEEMLVRLRKVLMKKGRLTISIIDSTPSLPCASTYMKHFGTLRNVYRLIGYTDSHYFEKLGAYKRWAISNNENAALLSEAFVKTGGRTTFDSSIQCLRVNEAVNICFGVAKWRKYEGRTVRWTLRRRKRQPPGWIVAVRLGEKNESVLDYILLRSTLLTGTFFWISEKSRAAHKIERFGTLEELARSLIRHVSEATRNTQLGDSGQR